MPHTQLLYLHSSYLEYKYFSREWYFFVHFIWFIVDAPPHSYLQTTKMLGVCNTIHRRIMLELNVHWQFSWPSICQDVLTVCERPRHHFGQHILHVHLHVYVWSTSASPPSYPKCLDCAHIHVCEAVESALEIEMETKRRRKRGKLKGAGIVPGALKGRRQPSVWDFTLDCSPEGIWRSPADRACVQQSALFSGFK